MAVKLVTKSPVAPVASDVVRQSTGIYGSDFDGYMLSLVEAATRWCEERTRRSFIASTWRETFDRLPASGVVLLSRAPVLEVSSIEYVDVDGVNQTLSADTYAVDTDTEPGRIVRSYGETWPQVRTDGEAAPVTVNYTAGYGDSPEDVPPDARAAVVLMVQHYDSQGEQAGKRYGNPMEAAKRLLDSLVWGPYA